MTVKDYKDYHQVNVKDKMMRDGLTLLENSLDGFEGYDVVLNNSKDTKVVFYDKYDGRSDVKKIIGYVEDIELGNLFKINDENWLVTTYPEDNRVYRKAEVQLCNSTFPIESDKTEVLFLRDENGEMILDDFDDPIPIESEKEIIQVPCIVETSYTSRYENIQLPLPDGTIKVTIQNQKASNLRLNEEFVMYGVERYKIVHFDRTKIINEKGLLTITADRVVNK